MLFSSRYPLPLPLLRLSFKILPWSNTPLRRFITTNKNTPTTASTMAQLKIHNSLKPGPAVPFIPLQTGKVSWYACGPTVYDHSHLGHARNYVSTDIIRRIMIDYFGLDMKFVMNITDIDDKIIIRARQQKLLQLEKLKTYSESDLFKLATDAFQFYAKEKLPELLKSSGGEDLSPSNYAARRDASYGKVLAGGTLTGEGKPGDDEAKIKMHLNNLTTAAEAIENKKIFGGADDILEPYLDSLYKETVSANDHQTWTDVTQYWEKQFMQDMDDLNVMRADVVTRVTEYVPQIVDFVDKIIQKGFAYETEGNVWFDIAGFEKAGNPYARLRPQSRNDKALQEEGEGSLGKSLGGKKSDSDFALWKKSKAGEPSWPSPWGEGRPGWHIECSVMASDVLGSEIDVHSGGIDLAFPHHDNELAQSEAYYCEHGHEHNWVKYFMHMGHLSISGSKMSKSLKNFQTIRDALKTDYTPRSMRIVFLLGKWNDGVEVSPSMRSMANSWESSINNFFINVKSHLLAKDPADLKSLSIVDSRDTYLNAALKKAKEDMSIALCNSFDTPQALKVIDELIGKANIHMSPTLNEGLDLLGLEAIGRWITKMVGIFGLDANATAPYAGLGWTRNVSDASLMPEQIVAPYADLHKKVKLQVVGLSLRSEVLDKLLAADVDSEFQSRLASGVTDPDALAVPYIRSVSQIRDEIRKIAPTSRYKSDILALSDQIRDYDLTNLGVYLDDAGAKSAQGAFIKFVPVAELLAQREEKAIKENERLAQKETAKLAREKEEAEKAEKAKIPPTEMFLQDARYSAWNENGLPTTMADGKEVAKSALKKLTKEWEKQKKVHEEWKAKAKGA